MLRAALARHTKTKMTLLVMKGHLACRDTPCDENTPGTSREKRCDEVIPNK